MLEFHSFGGALVGGVILSSELACVSQEDFRKGHIVTLTSVELLLAQVTALSVFSLTVLA